MVSVLDSVMVVVDKKVELTVVVTPFEVLVTQFIAVILNVDEPAWETIFEMVCGWLNHCAQLVLP
jgi:hypothetical protein